MKTKVPETNRIHQGDVLATLKTWPDAFVHCVVTSPPYWGLRDYGVQGQLGLEKTPNQYVAKMVAVFHELRRVLRKDGTLWINIGDSYAGSWGAQSRGDDYPVTLKYTSKRITWARSIKAHPKGQTGTGSLKHTPGIKAKDIVGIPWMLAFGLRTDGWYLRQDIIWAKPNPMPESVTDRCTKAHEYLFLFSKSSRYYFDADAIKEPGSIATKMPDGWETGPGAHGAFHRAGREKGVKVDKQRGHGRRHEGFNHRWDQMERYEQCTGTRNKRDVWTIATEAFTEAHFATFPEKLIEPCIMAGTPPQGVVLDPFMGAGTTALVALKLHRQFIGIELNPEYVKMAEHRIAPELAQGRFA